MELYEVKSEKSDVFKAYRRCKLTATAVMVHSSCWLSFHLQIFSSSVESSKSTSMHQTSLSRKLSMMLDGSP